MSLRQANGNLTCDGAQSKDTDVLDLRPSPVHGQCLDVVQNDDSISGDDAPLRYRYRAVLWDSIDDKQLLE